MIANLYAGVVMHIEQMSCLLIRALLLDQWVPQTNTATQNFRCFPPTVRFSNQPPTDHRCNVQTVEWIKPKGNTRSEAVTCGWGESVRIMNPHPAMQNHMSTTVTDAMKGQEQQLSTANVAEQLIHLGCGWCHWACERGPSITIKAH